MIKPGDASRFRVDYYPDTGWALRDYQRPSWRGFNQHKRAILTWHRRSGKDEISLRHLCREALKRPGTYWHMLPTYKQARMTLWDGVNPHTGKKRIDDIIPTPLRRKTRQTDMAIELINGSMIHLVGSDNYNTIVGSPPCGINFSEWSRSDPLAWAYMSPILAENDGWAIFNSTPFGKNHHYRMMMGAKDDQDWYSETLMASDTDVFTTEILNREKKEMIKTYGLLLGTALFSQEYLCSFDVAVVGAVYGQELKKAEEDGRINVELAVRGDALVHTAWDLGVRDRTSIWLFQRAGDYIHILDFIEDQGKSLQHYAAVLNGLQYPWGVDYLPHDVMVRDISSDNNGLAETRLSILRGLQRNAQKVMRGSIEDGIAVTRSLFPRLKFSTKAAAGVEHLQNYRYEWDERRNDLAVNPLHDHASHAADGLRCLAKAIRVNQQGDIWGPRPKNRRDIRTGSA